MNESCVRLLVDTVEIFTIYKCIAVILIVSVLPVQTLNQGQRFYDKNGLH
jgi:type IV secretory pathway component VirB8